MADKMTRKEALEFAIDNIIANCGDELEACGGDKAIETLNKMIDSIEKQKKRPKQKTTARIQNENYAKQVIQKVKERKDPTNPINASWIAQNIPFVQSSQRGYHVAAILLEWGAFEEQTIKGRKYYVLNEFWQPPTK